MEQITITRKQHLDWCKERAGEYLDEGNTSQAIASFMSDIMKHEGTAGLSPIAVMMLSTLGIHDKPVPDVRKWINDFN